MAETIRKRDDLPGATRLEAQGLAWLAEAMPDGGAHTVPVLVGEGWIEEPRLSRMPVTAQAAEAFGRALAVTHAAGAPVFGAAPPGWDGHTQMGRCDIRLRPHAPAPAAPDPAASDHAVPGAAAADPATADPAAPGPAAAERSWGEFYAQDRLLPYVRSGRDSGALSRGQARLVETVCRRLADGEFGEEQPELVRREARRRGQSTAVARTHGDLWCGNVLWVPCREVESWAPQRAGLGPLAEDTAYRGGALIAKGADDAVPAAHAVPAGASPTTHSLATAASAGVRHAGDVVGVLIDPLAQGAHAETDLAALGVFGQPYLDRIVAGYDEISPLAPDWADRVGLHQLHILMIHVHLFGGGYGAQAAAVARSYA